MIRRLIVAIGVVFTSFGTTFITNAIIRGNLVAILPALVFVAIGFVMICLTPLK